MRIRINGSTTVAQAQLALAGKGIGKNKTWLGATVSTEIYHNDDWVQSWERLEVTSITPNNNVPGKDPQTHCVRGVLCYDTNRPGVDTGDNPAQDEIVVEEYHPQSGGVVKFL